MSVKRILIVDDEKNLCLVIKACLENIGGWVVLTAHCGKEGLLLAQTELPNAILLDVMMPDMDGREVFCQLQKNPQTQEIPIILLTAKIHVMDLKEFAQLGVVGVIPKPFNPLKLAAQVAEFLGWEESN